MCGDVDQVAYSPLLTLCVVTRNPKAYMGIWVSMVSKGIIYPRALHSPYAQLFFDVVTFGLAIGNALDQPYQQRFQVIDRIKRDGALSFLVSGLMIVVDNKLSMMLSDLQAVSGKPVVSDGILSSHSTGLKRLRSLC